MTKENMEDLFVSELRDIFNAEEQIIKGLPHLIKAAESDELKDAFKHHLEETQGQLDRLKKVFTLLGLEPKGKPCDAMKGLIKECEEAIRSYEKSPLRDAAIISKAQRIEHYEIATYGTLKCFAYELNLKEIVSLLKKTLDEEANADKKLTKIAEGGLLTAGINMMAIES